MIRSIFDVVPMINAVFDVVASVAAWDGIRMIVRIERWKALHVISFFTLINHVTVVES